VPPWVRYVRRKTGDTITFPDHGAELLLHSAEVSQYRGPNLRAAWLDEPIKYQRGEELWRNLRLALRVPGKTPPRAVITTTPPQQIDWILALATEATTRVVRGAMRDNPALDERAVEAAYAAEGGTVNGARELDGEVVIGVDGALFRLAEIEAHRVHQAPPLESIVVAVDPAQSGRKYADEVGIAVCGIARGHIYVLASCSEKLEPVAWAERALAWAEHYRAGQLVVESTGSGSFPKATLEQQQIIRGGARRPVVESPARGAKGDRAMPLSAACATGRLHLVGRHPALERELTSWQPNASFSPGGLDAVVHAAAALTRNWSAL
jgi:phage terminase large subunit-like protein